MKNLFDVSGKVAVVTGGSRGIGAMIARGYVENGVRTYISSRKAAVCDAMADELSAYGECISLPNDLASVEGVERFCAEFREREEKLHILVNNAGADLHLNPAEHYPYSASKAGMIHLTRALARRLAPEDMAGAAIYLASRAAAYVTGAAIPVDGGIFAVS